MVNLTRYALVEPWNKAYSLTSIGFLDMHPAWG